MEKKTIGSFIAALRKANGLTQRELAEMLGVSDKAVSRWERDECYPDLTMIPVIAEIFGVSCDELLCGGRTNSEAVSPRQEQKAEKQLGYLADRVGTDFRLTSVWVYAVAALGFIAALICNTAFNRALLGFFIACAFYAAAMVLLATKLIKSFSALKYESDSPCIDRAKRKIIGGAARSVSAALILLAATLPLLRVENTRWGLSWDSWLEYSLPLAGAMLVVCVAASATIPRICAARGVYAVDESTAALDRLRLKITAICAAALVLTAFAHAAVTSNTLNFADRTAFDSLDDYVDFMKTPMEDDSIYDASAPESAAEPSADNDYMLWREAHTETVTAPDGTVLRTFLRRNETTVSTSMTWNGNELISISVVTKAQFREAQQRWQTVNTLFVAAYFVEAAAFIAVYLLKKRSLTAK